VVAEELGLAATEAETILAAAFDRWGEEMVPRLRGTFALLAWRESGGAVAAVDQLGAGGLFFADDGGRLLLASEIRYLLRLIPCRPAPARRAVVRFLANGFLERGRTLYEGVHRLTGGHDLRVQGRRCSKVCYWRPHYSQPLPLGRDAAAEAVRAAVSEAVASRVANGESGILLSGGLDSTSVAAVAAGLEEESGRLRAYSAVFPKHPSMDETPLIELVASHLGLRSRLLPVEAGSMLGPALGYLREWEVPSISPNLLFNLPLLRLAAEEGVSVVLDGQGGDELFGCAPFLIADRVRRGRLAASVRLARRYPGAGPRPSARFVRELLGDFGLKGALPPAAHALCRRIRGAERYSRAWFRPEAARLDVETSDAWRWKALEGPRWWAQRADEVTAQRERMGAHDFLRHKSAEAGVRGGHPYFDDVDLVGLVLRLDPELGFDPDLDRPLLRAAMERRLPDLVRLRTHKSYFNALFADCLTGADRPLILELLTAPDAEVNAYVLSDVVRDRLLTTDPSRRPRGWAWALWRLASVECWLRFQADPELLDRLLERCD
jgi:asparagine synthase (glutamine-hydrolysing)